MKVKGGVPAAAEQVIAKRPNRLQGGFEAAACGEDEQIIGGRQVEVGYLLGVGKERIDGVSDHLIPAGHILLVKVEGLLRFDSIDIGKQAGTAAAGEVVLSIGIQGG